MNLTKTAIAAASLAFAGQALAMPIESWTGSVEVSWSNAIYTPGAIGTSTEDYMLMWGDPVDDDGDQSSLQITPEDDGQPLETENLLTVGLNGLDFNDPGTIGTSVDVAHNNFPIFLANGVLQTATARVDLELTPTGGGETTEFSADFNIDFNETNNQGGDDGLCEDGGAAAGRRL